MTIKTTKIEYTENSFGRHTDVSYSDDTGHPLAARFAGWWDVNAVVTFIERCRKNDRNRV